MSKRLSPKTLSKGSQNKQPGIEAIMSPLPEYEITNYRASNKLANKIAIITGGDSGIGRAIATTFSKEGAQIVITYLNEHKDAKFTQKLILENGGDCLLISGDISNPKPMRRPGQPKEVAPSYVFLASEDASYMSGQILHPNGGVIING